MGEELKLNIIAEICVIPIGHAVSLRKEIAIAHNILRNTGLPVQLHSYGTNIEGDYDVIVQAIKEIHQTLHDHGIARIHTSIKFGSRTDKEQSLNGKIEAVKDELQGT